MLPVFGKVAESTLPVISTGCFLGATAFVGRKFVPGVACKAIGFAAGLLGNQNAEAWNRTGDVYIISAKKDAPRDLAFATGCFVLGLGARCAGRAVAELNKPEKERTFTDTAREYYEIFLNLKAYEYKGTLMIGIPVITAAGLWYGKKIQGQQNPQNSINQKLEPLIPFRYSKDLPLEKKIEFIQIHYRGSLHQYLGDEYRLESGKVEMCCE